MNRGEKITGIALGVALFLGIGFFVYSSMKSGGAGYENPSLADEEYSDEEYLGDEESTDEVAAEETPEETPAPAAPAKPAKK